MADDDSAAGDYLLFRYTGLADIPCPVCRDAGRDVAMGFLDDHPGRGPKRIREAVPVPSDLANPDPADNGLPRMAGRFLTDTPDQPVTLTCPACGRQKGPYTAQGLFRRLRTGQPLTER